MWKAGLAATIRNKININQQIVLTEFMHFASPCCIAWKYAAVMRHQSMFRTGREINPLGLKLALLPKRYSTRHPLGYHLPFTNTSCSVLHRLCGMGRGELQVDQRISFEQTQHATHSSTPTTQRKEPLQWGVSDNLWAATACEFLICNGHANCKFSWTRCKLQAWPPETASRVETI